MARFIPADFTTGSLELRYDNESEEIIIYGTAEGMKRLAEICLGLADRLKKKTNDHTHLEDMDLLTSASIRGTVAAFRS